MSLPKNQVFAFRLRADGTPSPWVLRAIAPLAERALGLTELARVYAAIPEDCGVREFLSRTLQGLNVGVQLDDRDRDRIPRTGSSIVVCNHPYGGIEGIALAHLLLRLRPDVKVMANYLLGRIPELRDLFLMVDPFATPGAARRNVAALRRTVRFVSDGGMLVVFPAGEVAHLHPRQRRVQDPPWDPTIGRVIRRAGCPVLPVRFEGRNGALFQTLGLVHPVARTAMLARELLNRRGAELEVRVGSPVTPREICAWPTDVEMVDFLRRRTEILAERSRGARPAAVLSGHAAAPAINVYEVTPPVPANELEQEVLALSEASRLVESPQRVVFIAEAEQIPSVLLEIGRLRELSFRAVGEGSGKASDLDDFDASYLHLFLWDLEAREVVGAYRIGRTDRLLDEGGLASLYTSSLFRFDRRLFRAMGPALEMGRSFIRLERQKSFSSLMLLWKGIGEFVLRNPPYTILFGPVSISADYLAMSQQLVASFLKRNSYSHPWSQWVSPRQPFRPSRRRNFLPNPGDLRSLEEVSAFVSELEEDGKGVPILLKQYFKLGGRLLGFNVDPDFSNVLDVLVMVDLERTERKILCRYMGPEGAETFLSRARSEDDRR